MSKKKTKKAKPKKAEPKKVEPRPNRYTTIAVALKDAKRQSFSIDEAVKLGADEYKRMGGSDNLKEATHATKRVISIFSAIGLVEVKGDTVRRTGKVV